MSTSQRSARLGRPDQLFGHDSYLLDEPLADLHSARHIVATVFLRD